MPHGHRRGCTGWLGDVRRAAGVPGIDWEAACGLPKGAPSPLREYAKLAPPRAAAVRAFARGPRRPAGVTVWAWNSPYSGRWGLDWRRIEDQPTAETVRRELAEAPEASAYVSEIVLCPAWEERDHPRGQRAVPAGSRRHPGHRDHQLPSRACKLLAQQQVHPGLPRRAFRRVSVRSGCLTYCVFA